MTAPDAIPEKYRHPFTYFKPAFGLILLREQILGKDRFDYAFKNYIANGRTNTRSLMIFPFDGERRRRRPFLVLERLVLQ
jgi:hypothetical protein